MVRWVHGLVSLLLHSNSASALSIRQGLCCVRVDSRRLEQGIVHVASCGEEACGVMR